MNQGRGGQSPNYKQILQIALSTGESLATKRSHQSELSEHMFGHFALAPNETLHTVTTVVLL